MKVFTVVRVCVVVMAIATYIHEMATGGGWIMWVKEVLMTVYRMNGFAAYNLAVTIITLYPLITVAAVIIKRER